MTYKEFNWQRQAPKPKPLTDKQRIKALEKLVEEQGRQIATLEDIAAEHIGLFHQLRT